MFNRDEETVLNPPELITIQLEPVSEVQLCIAFDDELNGWCKVQKKCFPVNGCLSEQLSVYIHIKLVVAFIFKWKNKITGR